MVMVGATCAESTRVEMLFSWCCLWLCPITSPAVHEVRHDGRAKGYHQVLEEVPHAVVHSHCCIHFFSVPPFCLFSGPWGNRSLPPKIPDSTQTSSNQPKIPNSNQFLIISPVRKIFFPYWKRDFLRAFLSHDKGTTSARGNHTIRYDAVRFGTIPLQPFSRPDRPTVRPDAPL